MRISLRVGDDLIEGDTANKGKRDYLRFTYGEVIRAHAKDGPAVPELAPRVTEWRKLQPGVSCFSTPRGAARYTSTFWLSPMSSAGSPVSFAFAMARAYITNELGESQYSARSTSTRRRQRWGSSRPPSNHASTSGLQNSSAFCRSFTTAAVPTIVT